MRFDDGIVRSFALIEVCRLPYSFVINRTYRVVKQWGFEPEESNDRIFTINKYDLNVGYVKLDTTTLPPRRKTCMDHVIGGAIDLLTMTPTITSTYPSRVEFITTTKYLIIAVGEQNIRSQLDENKFDITNSVI